jgi:hypothetical protein
MFLERKNPGRRQCGHAGNKMLVVFRDYYKHSRVHATLESDTPAQLCRERINRQADLGCYRWQMHWRGLIGSESLGGSHE